MRLASFAFGVVAAAAIFSPLPWLAVAGRGGVPLAVAAFVLFAVTHGRARRGAAWHDTLAQVCESGVHRVQRDWDKLPAPPPMDVSADHSYAEDLDVTGRASLWRLVDVVSPAPGRGALRSWLVDPPPPLSVIRDRQAAVHELVPASEWRDELAAHGRSVADAHIRPGQIERFFAWCEGAGWLIDRPLLRWTPRVLAALSVVAVGAAFASDAARRTAAIVVAANVLLTYAFRRQIARTFDEAGVRSGTLRRYAGMLDHVEGRIFAAPELARLQAALARGGGAARGLGRLDRLGVWAEARYSPMAHAVLQLLLLWDFHLVDALERWQRRSGSQTRAWLAALGQIDALSALATLASDNPSWTFPDVHDGSDARFEAQALGHPLLADGVRVANDVTVGPPGTLLLVTGSNMAGKSTLLRAIGLNVVLAQAGAPVCAAALRMPRVALHTSLCVQDSIAQGLSLFMAELQRLKAIVDAARAATDVPLLYLLDEMLHGTNTGERRIAARSILGLLLECRAIGAVTTHDLELAAEGVVAGGVRPVHFTDTVARDDGVLRMSFDYHLRPGYATSVNALKLLEMVGL